MSYWGSPAGDLFYFLISSVRDDVKVKYFDEFIEFYHQELYDTLKKLNYEQQIPTLQDIHEELLDKKIFGACILTQIMFICKYDSQDELTMEQFMDPEFMQNEQVLDGFFGNENFLNAVKTWLPFMHERGFL
jgi:hypothetical protein